MPSLRVTLLVVGIGLIAGIYLWAVIQRRRRNRYPLDRPLLRPHAARRPELTFDNLDHLDQADALASFGEDADTSGIPPASEPIIDAPLPADDVTSPMQALDPQLDLGFSEPVAAPTSRQRIIVLFVTTPETHVIQGQALLESMQQIGMRHGGMSIFHHYGVGSISSEQPLFSLANMYEPGEFELSKMDTLETSGLAMFMRLPVEIDGLVAFELMLNTAQRIAERFGGTVLDDDHQPLEPRAIDQIRETITLFENEIS